MTRIMRVLIFVLCLLRSGDRTGADEALAALQQLAATSYVSPHEFALVHVGMGRADAAIDALESAFANRDPWISMLVFRPDSTRWRPSPDSGP